MGVYIDKFVPKDGLYQIDQGKIHKYKKKGGTVRTYSIQEIDFVRCEVCKYGTKIVTTSQITCKLDRQVWEKTDFCSYGERRTDEHTD